MKLATEGNDVVMEYCDDGDCVVSFATAGSVVLKPEQAGKLKRQLAGRLKEVPQKTAEEEIAERMVQRLPQANGDTYWRIGADGHNVIVERFFLEEASAAGLQRIIAAALLARGDERAREERVKLARKLRLEAGEYRACNIAYSENLMRFADALARETA